jgi:hypothetical protein
MIQEDRSRRHYAPAHVRVREATRTPAAAPARLSSRMAPLPMSRFTSVRVSAAGYRQTASVARGRLDSMTARFHLGLSVLVGGNGRSAVRPARRTDRWSS